MCLLTLSGDITERGQYCLGVVQPCYAHSHCVIVHDAEVAARREVEDGGM